MVHGGVRGEILCGGARDDVQCARCVVNGFGEWSDDVEVGGVNRNDTVQRNESEGGLDAHECLGGCRVLDRSSGFGAQPEHSEVGVDGRRRPAARSSWGSACVVGVEGHPGDRASRTGTVSREIGQVGLAEHDGTGLSESRDSHGVFLRDHVDAPGRFTESGEAGRSYEASVVQVVLDHHRHTVERTAWPCRSILFVERGGDRQRVRVHGDQGVVMVFIMVDLLEESRCDLDGRKLSGRICGLDVLDGELDDVDRPGLDRTGPGG